MPSMATGKLAALDACRSMFDPGERWEYGINIDWVGRVVEKVSGQSLDAYFREHIFEPLGMTDTGFVIGSPAAARAPGAACTSAGRTARSMPQPLGCRHEPEFFMGGGGLYSTGPRLPGVPADAAARRQPSTALSILQAGDRRADAARTRSATSRPASLKTAQPDAVERCRFLPRQADALGPRLHDQHWSRGRTAAAPAA